MLHFIQLSMWHINVGSKGLRISPKDFGSHSLLHFLQANLAQFNSAEQTSFYVTFVGTRKVQFSLQGVGA